MMMILKIIACQLRIWSIYHKKYYDNNNTVTFIEKVYGNDELNVELTAYDDWYILGYFKLAGTSFQKAW